MLRHQVGGKISASRWRGLRLRRVLDLIASQRGLPEAIVPDNGPEFRGRALAVGCFPGSVHNIRALLNELGVKTEQRQQVCTEMSGKAMFGLWALLCGLVGVFRLARNSHRERFAWKLERALTLLAFLVAVVLLGIAIYSSLS